MKTESTDERANLPSASSFSISVNCPGQRNLLRSIPKNEGERQSSPEAERGTKIHKALEITDPSGLDESEKEAYDNALKNEIQAIDRWKFDLGVVDYLDGVKEVRMWLVDSENKPLLSGKADVIIVERDTRTPAVFIEDFKTMSGGGPASESWQGRVLAVLCKWEYNARHVRFFLNKCEKHGDQIDQVDFDAAALEQYESLIRLHLWNASLPDAPRRAGEHCNFCPCKAFCPDAAAMSMLPMAISQGGVMERIDTLTPTDLKAIWEKDSIIRKVLDKVEARLKTLPEDVLKEHGLKLGTARSTDKFTDTVGLIRRLQDSGIVEDQTLRCATIAKGKLVAILRRELNLTSDKAAESWIQKNLGDLIETKQGERPLVEIK